MDMASSVHATTAPEAVPVRLKSRVAVETQVPALEAGLVPHDVPRRIVGGLGVRYATRSRVAADAGHRGGLRRRGSDGSVAGLREEGGKESAGGIEPRKTQDCARTGEPRVKDEVAPT